MMEVTQADAYREACMALGETVVAQRLTAQLAVQLESENAELRAQLETARTVKPIEEDTT